MNENNLGSTTAKSNGSNKFAELIKVSNKDRNITHYFKLRTPIEETGETFPDFRISIWHHDGCWVLSTNACGIVDMGGYTSVREFLMSNTPYSKYIRLNVGRYSSKKLANASEFIQQGLDCPKFIEALCNGDTETVNRMAMQIGLCVR